MTWGLAVDDCERQVCEFYRTRRSITTAKRRKRLHGPHDWGEGDETGTKAGGLAAAHAAGSIGRIEPRDPAGGPQRFNVAIAAGA
jgi:hypothetical protein